MLLGSSPGAVRTHGADRMGTRWYRARHLGHARSL